MTQPATEEKKENIVDLMAGTREASDAEEKFLDGGDQPGSVDDVLEEGDPAGAGTDSPIPDWVKLPPNFKMPKNGRQVVFVRFRADWTDKPSAGERQAIMWNLTEADEKIALTRTRGDQMRALDELTKAMIRAVDGEKVNWERGPLANIHSFWTEVGGACRQQLKNIYAKNHTMDVAQATDFFTNCIAVRTVGT